MLVKIRIRSLSTSKGFVRNGDIVDLPENEVKRIMVLRPEAFEVVQQFKSDNKPKPAPKKIVRKRARKDDGSFQADNPSTPKVNEAWEE